MSALPKGQLISFWTPSLTTQGAAIPGQKQLAQAMQTNFRFAASGADQQSGMQAGNKYGPDAVGIAVAFVGPKGEALPNEAVVVRGGLNKPENFVNGTGVTIDANGKRAGCFGE